MTLISLEDRFDAAWDDCINLGLLDPGVINDFRGQCAATLARMPKAVRNFALRHCFIITHDGREPRAATYAPARNRWIIVADEGMRGDIQSTIAHEIAHARLGHIPTQSTGFSFEKEADDLSVKWGFVRRYRRDGFPKKRRRG